MIPTQEELVEKPQVAQVCGQGAGDVVPVELNDVELLEKRSITREVRDSAGEVVVAQGDVIGITVSSNNTKSC
jgi:hypothetical protein